MKLWPYRPALISNDAFIEAETQNLVDIYNRIVARKPDPKYINGAIMLRAAISSFDEARKVTQ